MLQNIVHKPEGIYETPLEISPAMSVSIFPLWQANKVMVRDNELKIDRTSSGICRIPVQEDHDVSIQLLREKVCTRLPTNGNGKCGLHAVLASHLVMENSRLLAKHNRFVVFCRLIWLSCKTN